jgi:hypothetical protein
MLRILFIRLVKARNAFNRPFVAFTCYCLCHFIILLNAASMSTFPIRPLTIYGFSPFRALGGSCS